MYQYFCTIANRLEPRSGPTKVGPYLGSSLFASSTLFLQKEIAQSEVFQNVEDKFSRQTLLYHSISVWSCNMLPHFIDLDCLLALLYQVFGINKAKLF